ncbi:hypothetical protein TNCV_2828631 [Trichonephila clavipes]|nr:hypothetical protein TNCV_2828631 [Trichonephila clavipes]
MDQSSPRVYLALQVETMRRWALFPSQNVRKSGLSPGLFPCLDNSSILFIRSHYIDNFDVCQGTERSIVGKEITDGSCFHPESVSFAPRRKEDGFSTEQRCNIKFCQRLGKKPMETLKMLIKVYSGSTMSRSKVYEWHWCFKEAREFSGDNECIGRPSTSRNAENFCVGVVNVFEKIVAKTCTKR